VDYLASIVHCPKNYVSTGATRRLQLGVFCGSKVAGTGRFEFPDQWFECSYTELHLPTICIPNGRFRAASISLYSRKMPGQLFNSTCRRCTLLSDLPTTVPPKRASRLRLLIRTQRLTLLLVTRCPQRTALRVLVLLLGLTSSPVLQCLS
jgi:hypothetical protein